MKVKYSNGISTKAIQTILGLNKTVPLKVEEMACQLRVTFYQPLKLSKQLEHFSEKLKRVFGSFGVEILDFDDTLEGEQNKKIKSGTVIIAPGEMPTEQLAINKVSNLYNNPVVGIYNTPCPASEMQSIQQRLDSVVGVFAWHMIHIAIFIDEHSWTICTMNGSVATYSHGQDFQVAVHTSLIPKLTAQVVPPNKSHDILFRSSDFYESQLTGQPYFNDFVSAGSIWAKNQLMLSHTSVDSLQYRNAFYKRIVQAYLDHRSGMSYGFLAWQLPVKVKTAYTLAEAQTSFPNIDWEKEEAILIEDKLLIGISLSGTRYVLEVPEVWVLSTRSGCNKTKLELPNDLVRLGLVKGKIIIEAPGAANHATPAKPSYDTLTILAHAVGNALVAGLMRMFQPNSQFAHLLEEQGCSLTHWHNYLDQMTLPEGHFLHGLENPSVACSTPQSAIYALLGKFEALNLALTNRQEFLGDVQVEPDHGTNISSTMSLRETARWIDAHHKQKVNYTEEIETE